MIGLGTMGRPIARRIALRRPRSPSPEPHSRRLEGLPKESAVAVRTPGEACQSELLITLLSTTVPSRGVLFEAGA